MNLKNKVVLITGGTGSFGRKFVELLLTTDVQSIRIFSRDEHKQQEMEERLNSPKLRFFLGDIRDKDRLSLALRGVNYVIHAAAYKQVQKAEYDPIEAIHTNINGTENVIYGALDNNVETVLFLSTDKAVHPINLYGATKLCAEKLIVRANSYRGRTGTKFCATRYGNVAGSRSTIVPIFFKLRDTGSIPITNFDSTRFWITLKEANQFVLSALEEANISNGGEIYIPQCPSVRIVDVAIAIAPRCSFNIIGNRVGDKMHEILLPEYETKFVSLSKKSHPFFIVSPANPPWNYIDKPKINILPFSSDKNTKFLSVFEIQESIKEWFERKVGDPYAVA